MVVLAVYLLVVAALWWAWWREDRARPRTVTPAPAPSSSGRRPAAPAVPQRRPRHRLVLPDPAITEDDVIAFGLALERCADVAAAALVDPGRPAAPRVPRDVG